MSYAVIQIQNQQFIIKPGDIITINGTLGDEGKSVKLGRILLLKDKQLEIGTPEIKGEVNFNVLNHTKSKKIRVATFKAKSRYRRVKGHRQSQTELELIVVGPLKKEIIKKTSVKSTSKKDSSQKTVTKTKKTTDKLAK